MVLSNKKLKQKLRAALAGSLAASEEAHAEPPNTTHNPECSTFKSLLTSATQKPRLSKREKRRKTLSLQPPDDSNRVSEKDSQEGGSGVTTDEKKRKRKSKAGEGLESGGSEMEAAKKLKKNKKKQKNKNKKGKKVEKSANERSEQGLVETIKASDGQETGEVTRKVYVGGIPYYSTEDDIRSYFESCGTIIDVDCMKFPESGKFRGIAIISFKTEAAAKRALAFDGSDMGGLFLKILPYKSTRTKNVSDFAPAYVEGFNRVYVGNLSWDITEDELRKLFSGCSISSLRFGEDKETQEFRGYAHVDFTDSLSLHEALKLDQSIVYGRPVRIRCAVSRKATESNSKSVPSNQQADSGGTSSSIPGKIRRRTCYECGEKGHLSSSCPKKQAADATNSGAT
ncbi:phragmoplastin interacting protein 1 [Diospyros lotus]|uniref:phragmoplastin interacting protein 1 n=1 Tax=Diospyros lotus TaxID=55363 RepID=UPI002253ECA3|nr:phragmoplastin interacting protein 1 [Diospyros lotus]